MRIAAVILTFFISSYAIAQGNASSLEKAVNDLDNALLKKDTVTLKKLLHDEVSYGHSNGWIENKTDIVRDLYDGTLSYENIKVTKSSQPVIVNNTAIVTNDIQVSGKVKGTDFAMKLHVLQAWVNTKNGWQLLGRQSVRIDKK